MGKAPSRYVHKTNRVTKCQRDARAKELIAELEEFPGGLKPNPIGKRGSGLHVVGDELYNDGSTVQDSECSRYRECLYISAYVDWDRFTCTSCAVWLEGKKDENT